MLGLLLAETYEAGSIDPTGWYMSEKLDGLRTKWDRKLRLLRSREGHIFPAPKWFTDSLPDTDLDGELWLGRGQLERTNSIVRSADDKGWNEINPGLIDIPDRNAGPFEQRQEALQRLFRAGMGPRVQLIPHTPCASASMLEQALDLVLAQGGEGLMLRKPGSTYTHARSTTLLKVLRWIDAEAVVVEYQPGKNGAAGLMGALWCVRPDGTRIKVGTGFSHKQRANSAPHRVYDHLPLPPQDEERQAANRLVRADSTPGVDFGLIVPFWPVEGT